MMEDQVTQEWMEAVARMMEVFEERHRLEESMDEPNFSMSCTQCPLFNKDKNAETEKVIENIL